MHHIGWLNIDGLGGRWVMDLSTATVAELLRATTGVLEVPPADPSEWVSRVDLVRTVELALNERGIDGESLIRYGLSHLFVGPVLGSVAVSILSDTHAGLEVDDTIDVAEWRRAMQLEGEHREFSDAMNYAAQLASGWIVFAPLEALVTMRPTTTEQLNAWAGSVDESVHAAAASYRWAVVRLLEANLDDWDTQSLKKEYRLTVMGRPANLPCQLVDPVAIDHDELAHAVARKTLDEEDERERASWNAIREAVVKQAKMLLGQGRCSEAAALFEFLIGRDPSDPWLRNNYAFCLITTRPADAYSLLREAQRLGFASESLVVYNRACCALTEAQKREVLFDASRYWLDAFESVPVPAYIWRRSDGALEGVQTPDVRRDLAAVVGDIALELGELERAAAWKTRLAQMGVESSGPARRAVAPKALDR